MSHGEIAYLVLVLSAFGVFIVTIGFISIWSQQKKNSRQPSPVTKDADFQYARVRFG